MKSTKKIIPALAMLLVSAVMMATASFAWFAMNSQADATGMTVQLKSNSQFLLIADSEENLKGTNYSSNTSNGTKDTTNFASGEILPVAHKSDITSTTIGTAGSWYTKNAANSGSSAAAEGATENTLTTLTSHVVKYSYYLGMAKGSTNAGSSLKLSDNITISATAGQAEGKNVLSPVRVVVVCGTAVIELAPSGNSDNLSLTSTTELAATVGIVGSTDFKATQVDVYIYYDGEDTALYTDNIGALANADIAIKLAVTDAATN